MGGISGCGGCWYCLCLEKADSHLEVTSAIQEAVVGVTENPEKAGVLCEYHGHA
jgi:hypothetical protein